MNPLSGAQSTALTVNGKQYQVHCADNTPLLYVLRNDLALNGPKFGCGVGQCGACVVLLDRDVARSCVTTVSQAQGKAVTTLDGLAVGERLHPLQAAFLAEQAAQCAFCMNGMIMTAKALLDRHQTMDDRSVLAALNHNLSGSRHRCFDYSEN